MSSNEKLSILTMPTRDELLISTESSQEMFDFISKFKDSLLSSIVWINVNIKTDDGKILSPTLFLSDLGDYCTSTSLDPQSHFSFLSRTFIFILEKISSILIDPMTSVEIPYFENVVTTLLKEALGGSCQTCVIAHCQSDNSLIEDKKSLLDGLKLFEALRSIRTLPLPIIVPSIDVHEQQRNFSQLKSEYEVLIFMLLL